MGTPCEKKDFAFNEYNLAALPTNEIGAVIDFFSRPDIIKVVKKMDEFMSFFQQSCLPDLLTKLTIPVYKKSFLVFKQHKYVTILTENIAFFYVSYDCATLMCFDGEEYDISQSLEQLQNQLPDKQFFRLNRQYLINFDAVKDVEHYSGRKLLVRLSVTVSENLLISKEKIKAFLQWLEDR